MDGQNELLAAMEAMKPLMESLGADKVKIDVTELETAIKSLRASVRHTNGTSLAISQSSVMTYSLSR